MGNQLLLLGFRLTEIGDIQIQNDTSRLENYIVILKLVNKLSKMDITLDCFEKEGDIGVQIGYFLGEWELGGQNQALQL